MFALRIKALIHIVGDVMLDCRELPLGLEHSSINLVLGIALH